MENILKNFKSSFVVLISAFCILNFMGCATYKFQRGKEPYNKGYVVSRDDYIIPEYTIGKDNAVPSLELAKERFKERRRTVGYYYEKMGYIENNLKRIFWTPIVLFTKFIGGIFRLPSIAIADYKYEHDPQYREKVRKVQQEQDALEEARIQNLKKELNSYIEKELTKEKN